MSNLVLVRHSESRAVPERPAAEWDLTAEGRRRCAGLANELQQFSLDEIVASTEPKAAQTAEILAAELGIGWRTAPGLHEHEREALPWLGEGEWHALLRRFFERPEDLVFGLETARQALDRFREAVEQVVDARRAGDLAIVTHGTVMSLYIGEVLRADPYAIWRQLEMPDLRVLSLGSSDRAR